ncbi:hypothetical protein [Mucilaginibacter sp. KACC 22063]
MPKRSDLGYTLNFANPWCYFIIAILFGAVIYTGTHP